MSVNNIVAVESDGTVYQIMAGKTFANFDTSNFQRQCYELTDAELVQVRDLKKPSITVNESNGSLIIAEAATAQELADQLKAQKVNALRYMNREVDDYFVLATDGYGLVRRLWFQFITEESYDRINEDREAAQLEAIYTLVKHRKISGERKRDFLERLSADTGGVPESALATNIEGRSLEVQDFMKILGPLLELYGSMVKACADKAAIDSTLALFDAALAAAIAECDAL